MINSEYYLDFSLRELLELVEAGSVRLDQEQPIRFYPIDDCWMIGGRRYPDCLGFKYIHVVLAESVDPVQLVGHDDHHSARDSVRKAISRGLDKLPQNIQKHLRSNLQVGHYVNYFGDWEWELRPSGDASVTCP